MDKKGKINLSLILIFISVSSYFQFGYSQKSFTKNIKNFNNTSIRFTNYYVNFDFHTNDKPDIKLDKRLFYYWFKNNNIHISQGDIGGKVLNGSYKAYYNSDQLKEKGIFCLGLKVGEWVKWFENGKIEERSFWKKGLLHRDFIAYDESGIVIKNFKYKNGILKGNCFQIKNDSLIMESFYKNGKLTKESKRKNNNTSEVFIFSDNCDTTKAIYYSKDHIQRINKYNNGQLYKTIKYSNRKLDEVSYYKYKDLVKKSFYFNGKKVKTVSYKDNEEIIIKEKKVKEKKVKEKKDDKPNELKQ
jgi:antitoxin component YwqK of YwqJK toxin-antitoxin module